LERTKIRLWVPKGLEKKNDYAGEDQQKFTGPNNNPKVAENVIIMIKSRRMTWERM
jgi:hypothetical protein